MMQIIFGSAIGFVLAQGMLFGLRQVFGRREPVAASGRPPVRAGGLVAGFIRYAAPVGAGAALLTLGTWAVNDYLAASRATHATSEAAASAVGTTAPATANAPVEEVAIAPEPEHQVDSGAAAPADGVDPFADPEFKVRHAAHRGQATLKETLLERSEAKARAELVAETQQHRARSQYDCEAAARAGRYLKAGLDVWGFAAWQRKYFPTEGYHGATLPECQGLENVLDPHALDLKSTVAQQKSH